jgi:hypothetical protein
VCFDCENNEVKSGKPSCEAFQLFDALEDRENARVTVMQPFALSLDQWPFGGYPVQRDVVVQADPACGADAPGGCTIQCGGLTLFVVTEEGSLRMRGLTLLNGGGRLGGRVGASGVSDWLHGPYWLSSIGVDCKVTW